MALIQINNRCLKVEAVSHAQLELPEENTENDWIELYLLIDGKDIILTGDEALTVWHSITRHSITLLPCSLKQAIAGDEPIEVAGMKF